MEKIGQYKILKELGRGGMGVVYKGVDSVIGRHVAIKTLRPEDVGDSGDKGSMGDRLLREARSAGILSHPSIVTIYGAGQDGDILYIAMEFVDGANLNDVLQQGRLNTEAILKILKQAAEGLDYAHGKGVVHRDIKPANLMIEPTGKVKIADFGIAKLNQAGVTKTTSSVGSPAYMSPEHVRAQSIDGRADQYSLGVMAYEMLTGSRPHDSEELTSLVFKVVFEPPDLSLVRALPKGERLEPIFSKVLSKAADERFASCEEFYDALASVLDENSQSAAKVIHAGPSHSGGGGSGHHMPTMAVSDSAAAAVKGKGIATTPPAANKGLLYGGIGLLAVVLLGGGGYYFSTNPGGGGGTNGKGKEVEKPTPPVLIEKPECSHTVETDATGIHGEVGLIFEVNESGVPENIRVTKSLHPVINARAAECLKLYRFQPSRLNGKIVRSPLTGLDFAF